MPQGNRHRQNEINFIRPKPRTRRRLKHIDEIRHEMKPMFELIAVDQITGNALKPESTRHTIKRWTILSTILAEEFAFQPNGSPSTPAAAPVDIRQRQTIETLGA